MLNTFDRLLIQVFTKQLLNITNLTSGVGYSTSFVTIHKTVEIGEETLCFFDSFLNPLGLKRHFV